MLRTHKLFISFAFCLPALAGVSPIGMATSDGDMEIGRVRMPGSATLYDGAVVETGISPARLTLRNGAVVRLGGGAKATIYADSLSLERGVGQIETSGDYAIRARSVTVIPTSHPARARLQLANDGALQVAALSGSFEVRRAGVSSIVAAGRSLGFAADSVEAGAAAPSEFKGCLAKSEKGYILHVENSKTVVALEGGSITAKAGDRVTVVGKPAAAPVAGAQQVVQVLRLTVDGHGCSSKKASAGAAGGAGAAGEAGGAATAAGLSATTVAVIGVAAASAALIPTIALTNDSSGSTTSSISPSSR